MVRPDEHRDGRARARRGRCSGCTNPAGASPVSVGAEAPSSRPQVSGRDSGARAGCQKSVRRRRSCSGEQARGPQHEVKPAASIEEQSGSRAAHVTAKAIPVVQDSERTTGPGGVWGAARVQGFVRNRRDPSRLPLSRQGGSYKSKTKSNAAERGSEGIVVPSSAAGHNAAGGKGPCFGRVRCEGKREGMAGKTGPNDPGAHVCDVQVRQPRCELWAAAKRTRPVVWIRMKRKGGDVPVRLTAPVWGAASHAVSRRPSVSRVREIRTHGLKGGPAPSSVFSSKE